MAVVRLRPPGTDKYGDLLGGEPSEQTIAGAFTAPRLSTDIGDRARDGTVVGLTLFAPYGSDIVRTDLIKVGDDEFRIDGDLGDWSSPLTDWRPGLTANLVRAVG